MMAVPVTLSAVTPVVNFTSGVGVYGTNPQIKLGSVYALWSGNASGDKRVINAGPSNDANPVLIKVLGNTSNTSVNTNFIVTGYNASDLNLDGRTIAAGPGNEINTILTNIFTHPGNTTLAANYIVQTKLP